MKLLIPEMVVSNRNELLNNLEIQQELLLSWLHADEVVHLVHYLCGKWRKCRVLLGPSRVITDLKIFTEIMRWLSLRNAVLDTVNLGAMRIDRESLVYSAVHMRMKVLIYQNRVQTFLVS